MQSMQNIVIVDQPAGEMLGLACLDIVAVCKQMGLGSLKVRGVACKWDCQFLPVVL